VHCIVPGGGLSNDDLRFVRSRKKFFIPVKVISKEFREKFLDLLQKAYDNGEIAFFNEAAKLALRSNSLSLVHNLQGMKWVVFCRKPFKSPGHVVRYSRILSFDAQSVSFAWKDYKNGNKSKVMTLHAAEFSRRFLLHVLPNRFVKIRHYGMLCSRNIKLKLLKCCPFIGVLLTVLDEEEIKSRFNTSLSELIPG